MDSLTQIVLGGAVGEAVLGKKAGNKAVLWGAVAGTVPDLDVFCRFFTDALTANELHRGFSHSILFSILFAPVLGWLAWKSHKRTGITHKEWSWMAFLSLVTHPLLDAHTSWGTQLFWPLQPRITYNNIFIVDPLYTLPFLIFLVLAMFRRKDDPRRRKLNNLGLIISCSYMLLTLAFKGIAHYNTTQSLQRQGIAYKELEVKPTPLNAILWCAFVKTDGAILLGYYSLLDGPGEIKFNCFPQQKELLGDLIHEDKVQRMIKLSRGWYIVNKEDNRLYFRDMRFGQAGSSEDPSSIVFTRELTVENGELKVGERFNKMDNAGRELKRLMRRMLGDKSWK